jgi:YD repeat-containing protein
MTGMTEGSTTAAYGYDTNGNRSYVQYNNGLREEYHYNFANMLTTLTNKDSYGSVLSEYTYTYTVDGNQISKTDHTGKVNTYTYDDLGRLTNETEAAGGAQQIYSYAFDDSNNRSSLTATGIDAFSTTYAYDLNNRLLTEIKATSASTDTTTYYYDDNGNQTATKTESVASGTGDPEYTLEEGVADSQHNSYNGFDQLTEVETEDGAVSYTYFPSGLRASKTVGGVLTDYILDGGNVVLEMAYATVSAKYTRAINLVSSTSGGSTSYYLYNGHGDVVQLADYSGTVTNNYTYDAFGIEKNIDTNDTNPFRYWGEYFNRETGTYYLRARYYNPIHYLSINSEWVTKNLLSIKMQLQTMFQLELILIFQFQVILLL